jgi:hypothetical protein
VHAVGIFECDEVLRDVEGRLLEGEVALALPEFQDAVVEGDLSVDRARPSDSYRGDASTPSTTPPPTQPRKP